MTALSLSLYMVLVLIASLLLTRALYSSRRVPARILRAIVLALAAVAAGVLWGGTIRLGVDFAEWMNTPSLNFVPFAIIVLGVYPAMFAVTLFGAAIKENFAPVFTTILTVGVGLSCFAAVVATSGYFNSISEAKVQDFTLAQLFLIGWSGIHWIVLGYMLFVLCIGATLAAFHIDEW
ncbi:MAG: hypothetical protein IPG43_02235 [Proteobacteria bacterium]|nr:hypothetical protein [Pseudomonadota bacterium]